MRTLALTAGLAFVGFASTASAQHVVPGPLDGTDLRPELQRIDPADLAEIDNYVEGGSVVESDVRLVDEVVSESFTTEALEGDWVVGGSATLTAGNEDLIGDGWLRLTSSDPHQSGFAYLDEAFSSDEGIIVSFDYASWGGSGADGFSVFLFDGAVAESEFQIGTSGGSLGYAQSCNAPGVTGGYVGIGIDEFGNYSSPDCHAGGFERIEDSIVVRGPADEDYVYVSGTESLPYGLDCPAPTCETRPDQGGDHYRHVEIHISPVDGAYEIAVYVQAGADGALEEIVTPLALPSAPPATLKLGFGASTGVHTNVHEIRNVVVTRR